jgi:hypothetical protein
MERPHARVIHFSSRGLAPDDPPLPQVYFHDFGRKLSVHGCAKTLPVYIDSGGWRTQLLQIPFPCPQSPVYPLSVIKITLQLCTLPYIRRLGQSFLLPSSARERLIFSSTCLPKRHQHPPRPRIRKARKRLTRPSTFRNARTPHNYLRKLLTFTAWYNSCSMTLLTWLVINVARS